MGCCHSFNTPGQMPQNPVIIEEIKDNMKEIAKNSTFLNDEFVENCELSQKKKELIQKEYTNINSDENLAHKTNRTNTNIKKVSIFEEEIKKDEQKVTTINNINVILNKCNSETFKNKNTEISMKPQSSSYEHIHIKGFENTEKIVKSNALSPKTNGSNVKSPMAKMKVGPEIFVQLKNQNIYNKYSVGQTLGKGAYGQVRLVTNKATGLVRAMKIMKKSSQINENENKFFAELVILKNLDHPNIVKLLELFQDDENYYLITEYCSGGELFERLKKMNFLTESHAAIILKQILLAVLYCHTQAIVHRDLKPENIVFESAKLDSLIKIIDFGTSRKFDPKTKMTKTLGTAYYIAPEVLNHDYNEKCDIWSCGVILYILLCGHPPFTGKTQEEIFYRVKLGKFEFKEDEWANISEDAKSLIKQMLRYDQKTRISADEALNHKWIKRNSKNNLINANVIKNLSMFQATNQMQAAIYTFIVGHLTPPQEKEELQKCFEKLDKNGDGKLSPEELIDAYKNIYDNKDEAKYLVARIIKEADNNFSGKIDYTEFLVASTKRERLLAKNKVEQAFKLFDIDGNGFITKDELSQLMGENIIDDEIWNEILKEFDTNQDGKISQNEFIDLLFHKYN